MAARKSSAKPKRVTLRSYDVGFGDCFLLSFHYAQEDRHVLIDFGSTRTPTGKSGRGDYMERIARQIAEDCDGKLQAVVASHRHKDHISGFTVNGGKGAGAIIRALKPELVIQSWTEDPHAAADATRPSKRQALARTRRAMHVGALRNMNLYAEFAQQSGKMLKGAHLAAVREQLEFLGDDNSLANREAVKNLMTMGRRKPRYVYFGSRSGLDGLLPGVVTHVLGPPTLDQTETIAKQRSEDKEQFWLTHALRADFWAKRAAVANDSGVAFKPLFPSHVEKRIPWDARWYRYHAQLEQAEAMLSIVRSLDDQMNNTSVILLFEVAGKMLLFPGDAQYENWMYALAHKSVKNKLAKVDLYKVGHHGSRNATPKDLWEGFAHRGGSRTADRLITFLSTKDDVHGREAKGTEVPRKTLVDALDKDSRLVDTRTAGKSELSVSCTIDLT